MARAMWKGVIQAGGVEVPVKLYAAAVDRRVHFRLLHAEDLVPIRQRMVHPHTGAEVPPDDVRRAYELEQGLLVLLEDDELRAPDPPASRTIELLGLVRPQAIPPPFHDRPYHLGPDGDERPYLALVEALRREEGVAIARWVMRRHRYAGAIVAREGRLQVTTLRHADEVVGLGDLEVAVGRDLDQKELALARQLTEALASPFEHDAYQEGYRQRVAALVAAKAEGREVAVRAPRRKRPARSLARALRESLRAVGGRHVA